MKQKKALLLVLILSSLWYFWSCNNDDSTDLEEELKQNITLTLTQNRINGTSADLSCQISNTSNYRFSTYGLCWNTTGNPTTDNEKTEHETTSNAGFSDQMENLIPSSSYFVKAYVKIEEVILYSDQLQIMTTNGLPVLTTTPVSDITINTATIGGEVTDNGGFSVTARGVCWSTGNNPSLADEHTSNGSGTGRFTNHLTGLSANTKYYVRSFATNSEGKVYGNELSFTTYQTNAITDYDGNYYNIITIGNQVWMAENLRVTHYPDGTPIPLETHNTLWSNLKDNNTDDAFCYYNNDTTNRHGVLYTWAAAMGDDGIGSTSNPSGVQGACPDGWHLPSEMEWIELVHFIENDGYSGQVGKALKSTTGWNDEGNGTDIYGFNALPVGRREPGTGTFNLEGDYSAWCNSRELWDTLASNHQVGSAFDGISWGYGKKSQGWSVRCVKDQ